MNGRNPWRVVGACIAAAGVLAAGCGERSKIAHYRSPFRDFTCDVPAGWPVIRDSQDRDYYQITFTGPFDPNFYRGVPSLSVRWYRNGKTHRLPDSRYELYSSAQDFMDQMLHDVYGPDGYFKGGDDADQSRALARGEFLPDFERIRMSGGEIEGRFFVAYHNLPAPSDARYGVVSDDAGHRVLRERHGYAVLPVRGGFYVLVYPATRSGFERQKPAFLRMIKSFRLLSEGPR